MCTPSPAAPRRLSPRWLWVCTAAMLGACSQDKEPPAAGASAAPPPPAGYPARGAELDLAALDHYLPPPARDAVPYGVRVPLRNGRTVPQKKRWIWLPAGGRMQVTDGEQGKLQVRLPRGTVLWKEFYLQTPAGLGLVERRIVLKVADANEDNGWLLNGGWRFYAAHHLPEQADGVNGFLNELRVPLGSKEAQAYIYPPDAWLPTRPKTAATYLTLEATGGATYPYVFPGKTNCEYCHGGATAAFANAEPFPVLAFAASPEIITVDAIKQLVQRKWLEASPQVLARLTAPTTADEVPSLFLETVPPAPASQPAADPLKLENTELLLAVLRNNCLSCHSSSQRAPAIHTAFVLDPGVHYGQADLLRRLMVPSLVMGRLSKLVVQPGAPDESELVLRLRGSEERRRMPPAEGGLPEPDERLITRATRWVAALPQPAEPQPAEPQPATAAPAASHPHSKE